MSMPFATKSAPKKERHAVVLANLGGPENSSQVRRFLFSLFFDRAILPLPLVPRFLLAQYIARTREQEARVNYAKMTPPVPPQDLGWVGEGGSPLVHNTRLQARALQARLHEQDESTEYRCVVAMRHSEPSVQFVMDELRSFAPQRVSFIPLYPHYSTTTTGSSIEQWRRCVRWDATVRCEEIGCYPTEPHWLRSYANRIKQAYGELGVEGSGARVVVLFSAHGLPRRVVERGDPYAFQIERCVEALVALLRADGLEFDDQLSYQSRVGRLEWLRPYTEEILPVIARDAYVVLVPIAFVSEHIETLVECDRDYRDLAMGAGCLGFVRAPTPSVESHFIDGLASMVQSFGVRSSGGGSGEAYVCPSGFARCGCRELGLRAVVG